MEDKKNGYGYSTEEHIAWKAAQERDARRRGWSDPLDKPGEPVHEPEEFFTYASGKGGAFDTDNALRKEVLAAHAAERAARREKLDKYAKEIEKEAKEREEAARYNRMPPYKKLSDALCYYARYLENKKDNSNDIELARKIYSALFEVRNGNFTPLIDVFNILKERALTDQDLAYAVPEWESYFNQCKEAIEKRFEHSIDERKEELARKRDELEKISFFGKCKHSVIVFLKKITGKEAEYIEEGKKR